MYDFLEVERYLKVLQDTCRNMAAEPIITVIWNQDERVLSFMTFKGQSKKQTAQLLIDTAKQLASPDELKGMITNNFKNYDVTES